MTNEVKSRKFGNGKNGKITGNFSGVDFFAKVLAESNIYSIFAAC